MGFFGLFGSSAPSPPEKIDLSNKLFIVTGGNSGLGLESARYFAGNGAEVILGVRTVSKGDEAKKDIVSTTKCAEDKISVMQLDLASLESVRTFASDFKKLGKKIDVLMLNAGMVAMTKELTKDGFESTFQSNHLGHFLLTNLLLPDLKPDARAVVLSSGAHFGGKVDLDNLNYEKENSFGFRTYSDTKLQNVLFTIELSRRLKQKPEYAGIVAHACHPGVVASNFFANKDSTLISIVRPLISLMGKDAKTGALTQIYLSVSEEAGPGKKDGLYWDNCQVQAAKKPESQDAELTRKFWDKSAQLCGLKETI